MTDEQKQEICKILALAQGWICGNHPDPICRPHYKWKSPEGIWCTERGLLDPFLDVYHFMSLLEWTHKQEWFGWTETFKVFENVTIRFFHSLQLAEQESEPFAAGNADTFREAFILATYKAVSTPLVQGTA